MKPHKVKQVYVKLSVLLWSMRSQDSSYPCLNLSLQFTFHVGKISFRSQRESSLSCRSLRQAVPCGRCTASLQPLPLTGHRQVCLAHQRGGKLRGPGSLRISPDPSSHIRNTSCDISSNSEQLHPITSWWLARLDGH